MSKRVHEDNSVDPAPKKTRFSVTFEEQPASETNEIQEKSQKETFEAKSLRSIRKQKGFEGAENVLGDVVHHTDTGNIQRVEGEEKESEKQVEEGVVFDPFHLQDEREEGTFDISGNYHEKKQSKAQQALEREKLQKKLLEEQLITTGRVDLEKIKKVKQQEDDDEDDQPDAWADSLETTLAQKDLARVDNSAQETNVINQKSELELKKIILDILEYPDETVRAGLARLKPKPSKHVSEVEKEKQEKFNKLTDAAMQLMQQGDYEIYSETREAIEKDVEITKPTAMWEYKWEAGDAQTYGPYTTQAMIEWQDAGHFDGIDVYVRQAVDNDDDMFAEPSTQGTTFVSLLDVNLRDYR
jgi:CD2 antigen cytoplasmic tail-binding protein 2